MIVSADNLPLVSVIIPTFNYARFLPRAIQSVIDQTYKNFEIIIIDDGSTDGTGSVVKESRQIKYFFQANKGLPSARNAGIEKSKGDYLVFLDADDWLEPDALQQNLSVLKNEPGIAFISGNYYLLRAGTSKREPVAASVTANYYARLLESNYIGMHAAVMFQRWVFEKIRYDETLKACEDYDLYLAIARTYPVKHHQKFIATYYFHSSGLSHNYPAMIDSIKTVLKKQSGCVRSAEEKDAYVKGLQQWQDYYQLMKESV